MDISIIIVNWNTCQLTCQCLESIYTQTAAIEYEIILVDNASTDGSVCEIQSRFPQTNIIKNTENKGFAAANNQGIQIAKGRYVLLLNSDTVLLDNCLEQVVRFADSHPDAACTGCAAFNEDMTPQINCFRFYSLFNELLSLFALNRMFPKSSLFNRMRYGNLNKNIPNIVNVVAGCFMLVRREAIDQVGMMDEDYFMYAEEMDWCMRFNKAGWKIMFAPGASIIHFGGASSQKLRPEMLMQQSASVLLYVNKHHNRIYYRLACLLMCLRFFSRFAYWLVRSILHASTRKVAWQTARTYIIAALRSTQGYQSLCYKRPEQ